MGPRCGASEGRSSFARSAGRSQRVTNDSQILPVNLISPRILQRNVNKGLTTVSSPLSFFLTLPPPADPPSTAVLYPRWNGFPGRIAYCPFSPRNRRARIGYPSRSPRRQHFIFARFRPRGLRMEIVCKAPANTARRRAIVGHHLLVRHRGNAIILLRAGRRTGE